MIIDHGSGVFQFKAKTFDSEEERERHNLLLEIRHRSLCKDFGLDYDELVKDRKAESA